MQKIYHSKQTALLFLLLTLLTVSTAQAEMGEVELTQAYCAYLGGETETPLSYWQGDKRRHVFVDCETDAQVIEAGLDKHASLDSVQQAQFFHQLSGKRPVIVIYDTDGIEGAYEYRIRKVAQQLNIEFRRISPSEFLH